MAEESAGLLSGKLAPGGWDGRGKLYIPSCPALASCPVISHHSQHPPHVPDHSGLKVGDPRISATHFGLSNPHVTRG